MHIFIDDSGDPAFKMAKGSTKYLVIACAIFETNSDAEETSMAIEKYRLALKFDDKHEFRFSKTKPNIRNTFLREVANYNFFVRAIVIDKRNIHSEYFRKNNKSLYNFAIKEVLTKSKHLIRNAGVKIDGSGGREMRQALQNYLKLQVNQSDVQSISKIKLVDSKSDNLIQLADMLAGAIRRSFEGDDADYYKAALYEITSRDKSDIWVFK